jgi:hypothetical protein
MTIQILGGDSGASATYRNAGTFVFPNSFQATLDTHKIRSFNTLLRTVGLFTLHLYENTVDDLASASLKEAIDFENYELTLVKTDYTDRTLPVDLSLDQGKYYWVGFKKDVSFYIARGSGAGFAVLDNDNGVVAGSFTTPSQHDFNFNAEIIDTSEQATVAIASPSYANTSLLRSDAQYQQIGAQVKHDKFTANLRDITVFDDGNFLISNDNEATFRPTAYNDSFNYELAAPSSSFGQTLTATVVDASFQENT